MSVFESYPIPDSMDVSMASSNRSSYRFDSLFSPENVTTVRIEEMAS